MMKITVSKKMSHNPFGYEEFDMQSTGASSLSVTTEGSNEVSSLHPPSSSSSSSSRKNTSCISTPKSAAASSSSSSSPPPEQQQQQQQQQSFRFQGLYKLLGKNNNSNNDKTDASRALLSGGDDVDVVDHEKTVDHVLSGMAESPEQARDLLRGIVADLLRENDSLKARLTEKEKALQSTQEEYNIVKEEYTDRLISIKKTVERSIGGGSCGFEIIPNAINNNNNNGSSISKSSSTDASSKNALHVISPEQATDMVIQALSNKVEQLSVEKETLEQDLKQTSERMEDLESINETRLFKIEALESQFRSVRINSNPTGLGLLWMFMKNPIGIPLITHRLLPTLFVTINCRSTTRHV